MEAAISTEFKKKFLLTFTRELILHSEKRDITKLQKIIEIKEEEKSNPSTNQIDIPKANKIPVQGKINESLPTYQREISISKRGINIPQRRMTIPVKKPLTISEPKLPAHLEYLKPIPTAGIEIDLFKINPLIKDPAVRIIEANPDEKVRVTGAMGTKPTSIVLSEEDIDRIISKFSEVSKIPIADGIYRVVAGNLILSAINSNLIGSRFVIKKMIMPQGQQIPQRR